MSQSETPPQVSSRDAEFPINLNLMKKARGYLFILTVLLTFLTELSVPSRASAESVELLSYSELMALPLEKRTEYIQGVREILMDLSKNKDGRFSDSSPEARSRLEAWLKNLDSMFPVAQASEAAQSCSSNPVCRKAFHTCFGDDDRSVQWVPGDESRPGSYKCGPRLKGITFSSVNDLIQRTPDPQFSNGPRPQNIQKPEAVKASTSPSSRNLLRELTGGKKANTKLSTLLLDDQIDTMEKFIEHTQSDVQLKCYSKYRNKSVGPELTKCTDAQEVALVQSFEKNRHFAKAPTNDKTNPPSDEAVSIPIVLGGTAARAIQVSPLPDLKDETELPPKSIAPKAAVFKSKHACAPTPETCEAPSKTRAQVFQGGLPCVFAGMVSDLDSKNRRCQAVMSFKVGEQNFSCAQGQTMCNPLLFGTVNATTPICIGRGQSATVQCSKLSAPRDAERFLNRNISGLQDNWNEFREKFKSVCEPGTIQAKFHCVECNVMRKRLFELHARVLSDPCRSRMSGEDAVDARIRIRSAPKAPTTK